MINNNPKISIIIPVYNVELYLRECMESILNQTLDDIEVIIINDGSTDSSKAIVEEYRCKFKKIKIINKENEGVSVARNVGVDNSTGEYLIFLDSDDYLEPNMCEVMYKLVNDNNAYVGECAIRKFNDSLEKDSLILHNINNDIEIISSEYALDMYLKYEIRGYVWNKIFKRDFFIKNKMYFPVGVLYEDMIVSLKACILTNKFVLINIPLYNYRERNGSASRIITEKNIHDYVGEIDRCIKYCKSNINVKKHKEYLDAFFIMNYLNAIHWYIGLYNCRYTKIYKNYKEFFGAIDYNFRILDVLKIKTLSRNYKIIYILWKLNIYHLFIKFKVIK